MAKLKQVTDASFAQDVLEADGLVVVDFWAPWCGPCRAVAPVLEQVAQQYEGRVTVAKINVDENPKTAAEYGISGIPTVLIFRNGSVEKQLVGVQQESVYISALD